MTSGDWRRFWLWVMFLFDAAMLVCWWFSERFFFWTFVGINLVVIIGEIVSYLTRKKSLSTTTTQTIQYDTRKRVFVYLALSFMMLALSALYLHLVII